MAKERTSPHNMSDIRRAQDPKSKRQYPQRILPIDT